MIQQLLDMNNGKKFDVILMNPPFNRSMHLKFLEKTIEIANNVVSVQPVRWLEEVIGKDNKKSAFNKYENSISKHIKDLELITQSDAKKLFSVLPPDLAIYICDENGGFNYKSLSENSIIEKIIKHIENNKCNLEFNKKDGYRVRVPFINPGGGKSGGSGDRGPILSELPVKDIVFKDGKYNDKWWYEYYMKNQHSKTTEEITSSIKFNSEEEGHNFVKSLKTEFVRYVESCLIVDVNINNSKILWMGNSKHPRTGSLGYIDEWTNEDFETFFNLTEDEINLYKTYINDFEISRKEWLSTKKKK